MKALPARRYIVNGACYADASLTRLRGRVERCGAFDSWRDAYLLWERLSWRDVDDCLKRYFIVDDQGRDAAREPDVAGRFKSRRAAGPG